SRSVHRITVLIAAAPGRLPHVHPSYSPRLSMTTRSSVVRPNRYRPPPLTTAAGPDASVPGRPICSQPSQSASSPRLLAHTLPSAARTNTQMRFSNSTAAGAPAVRPSPGTSVHGIALPPRVARCIVQGAAAHLGRPDDTVAPPPVRPAVGIAKVSVACDRH